MIIWLWLALCLKAFPITIVYSCVHYPREKCTLWPEVLQLWNIPSGWQCPNSPNGHTPFRSVVTILGSCSSALFYWRPTETSWLCGVGEQVSSISAWAPSVRLLGSSHEACSFSRCYQPMSNPLCFSTTILSWHLHGHQLHSLSMNSSRLLPMIRHIFCVSYLEPVLRTRTTHMMLVFS